MTVAGSATGQATMAELAASAVADVMADLADLGSRGQRGVVVDSPPGAGKSALVVRAAAELAAAGEQVMVVAQTNNQVDDLVDRLAAATPGHGRRQALGAGASARGAGDPASGRHCRPVCRRPGRLPGGGRHGREMGDGQRWLLAVGDHRRGVPDALGHADPHRGPVRTCALRW